MKLRHPEHTNREDSHTGPVDMGEVGTGRGQVVWL